MMSDLDLTPQLLSKPETITEEQYGNPVTMKNKISAYDHKLSQLHKIIKKQHRQNEYLKQELKSLNDKLTSVLEKTANQKIKQNASQVKDDVLKRQLENSMKQIASYKKEINTLKIKLEAAQPLKVDNFLNELKAKDTLIEELTNKVKTLEKMGKVYQTSDISKLEKEMNNKVAMLTQELAFQKKRILDSQKTNEKQQERRKTNNRSYSVGQIKQPIEKEKPKASMYQTERKINTDEIQVNKLKQNIQVLETSKAILSKKFKSQLEFWQNKCKRLQEQLQEQRDRLVNKQKQSNIVLLKFNQLKRRSNQTLEPIKRNSVDIPISIISDKRREFRGIVSTINRQFNGTIRRFDDSQGLPIDNCYHINKVSFRWRQDHIVYMSTEYTLQGGQIITKECFGSIQVLDSQTNAHYKRIDLQMKGGQYIIQLEGFYSSKQIEYLKISTSRKQTIHVGSEKNQAKCKKLQFQINGHEKPTAFLGSVVRDPSGMDTLISLGLELRKKDVNQATKKQHDINDKNIS